ncbi:hypothetical protein BJ944DRAFT_236855 [Cunninghamella echinulata]|nr:hypothetical protein BJ944DRAFT_236855 [Cunninghamella echinulata]
MATLQHSSEAHFNFGTRRNSTHQSFINTKTVANVITKIKPPSSRQLVDLPVTSTIEEAFDILLAEDILSVPIYKLVDNKKIYLTIIGVIDLLKLLNQHQADAKTNFFQLQILEAIGQTEESSKLVTVQLSDSLEYVLSLFSEHGAHRVLVQQTNEQQPILLSQMDVIRYLQSHNHHLGSILDETVPSLVEKSLIRKRHQSLLQNRHYSDKNQQVVSLNFKTTAMNAFLQIANNPHISALPIVDDINTLVGEISPQDLRGLNRDRLQELTKPVLMFLKSRNGDLYAPVTVHHRFTLSQIMAAIVLRNAYRLWWIDQDGHIKGVITLTDVLGSFLDDTL